ncbi:MAG: glutamate mutase L [Chloroflexi bacterium]|nr:glutamate mutase L [Chloroflexota bacterium]
MTGGTDGGAAQRLLRLVDTLELGIGVLSEKQRVFVLYAGNKALREAVNNQLKAVAHVQVAENVRPSLRSEYIDDAAQAISALYEDVKIERLPGIKTVQSWTGQNIMPTAQAFALITKYFAALQNQTILGIDIGSDSVTLISANARRAHITVRTDLGMGKPLATLLDKVSPADIARWIPEKVKEEEIRDFILYKSLYPQTLPQTEFELYLEQAVARELIRCLIPTSLPHYSMILARGGILTNTPRPAHTVLMLLDALQPTGIFSIALDKYNVLPALGILAKTEPTAVVQALEAGVLTDLGWVIVPTGKGQSGQSIMTGVVDAEGQGQFNLDIEQGTIDTTILGTGQIANVTLNPHKQIDIGFGEGKSKKSRYVAARWGWLLMAEDGRCTCLILKSDAIWYANGTGMWGLNRKSYGNLYSLHHRQSPYSHPAQTAAAHQRHHRHRRRPKINRQPDGRPRQPGYQVPGFTLERYAQPIPCRRQESFNADAWKPHHPGYAFNLNKSGL